MCLLYFYFLLIFVRRKSHKKSHWPALPLITKQSLISSLLYCNHSLQVIRNLLLIFFFPPSVVLVWADILAMYAVWVMMTYLTNVWKLNLTHAAAIVNVFNGAAAILPIGMAFLVDAFMGHYRMLLLSSVAYSIVRSKFPVLRFLFLFFQLITPF